MPNLSSVLDTRELSNLYTGKVIVFVEAESDANLFNRFIGPGYGEFIEFQVPGEKASGCEAVKGRVRQERNSNKRIYGLIDGEAAVGYGAGFDKLLKCDKPLFDLEDERLEGILFLAEHEAENILIIYADVCTYIAADETLAGLGKRNIEQITDGLAFIVERQFWAAICKYASYRLYSSREMSGILSNSFFEDTSAYVSMRSIKAKVKEKEGSWHRFLGEVKTLRASANEHMGTLDSRGQNKIRLRLADGKMVLNRLQNVFNVQPKWQGHLTKEVAESQYADDFRDELFQRTGIHR